MNLADDDFTLFGLPERFTLDRAALDARWRDLQAVAHPDRFAHEGAASQRLAMQWAVRVNEAYARLKDPLKRAAYLCERRGAAIDAERNTAMPAEFLAQQMHWREALDEATGQPDREAAVQRLDDEVAAAERALLERVARQLDDEHDAAAAAAGVRALMFLNRFRQEVERRLETLESGRT
ncbi:MAG: Fe-S protein assembly co-chaperone HscB [Rubrivivax sp.]|nr:Fe-S protein assembly co-chaperone HscB [Rubrivivax sp.]